MARIPLTCLCALIAGSASAVEINVEMPMPPPFPAAAGARAPRGWAAGGFLPVTSERLAAQPQPEQAAWRRYRDESIRRARLMPAPGRRASSSTAPAPVLSAGSLHSKGLRLGAPPDFYASPAARDVADRVVTWQTAVGGWTKSGDYSRDRGPGDDHHDAWSRGTFDNDATISELRYLASVAAAMGPAPRAGAWRESFLRGLDYVLAAQFPNGGFPQIYPLVGGYHDAVTFNDDAMVHILELLRDIAAGRPEFQFVPAAQVRAARDALDRGIRCVLATQLRTPGGRLLVWGQQHDPITLQPCAARNFEPVAACASESAGIVAFLISIPRPGPAIVRAIDGAIAWYAGTALHGVGWDRRATTGTGLSPQPGAPDLWARFYELETGRAVFGERDRTCHYAVTELSAERRLGYAWFTTRPAALPRAYANWKKRRK